MPQYSHERLEYVKDVLSRFPSESSLALAKKLYAEHPEWFTSIDTARGVIRYQRGNRGKRNREQVADSSFLRPNQVAGQNAYPPSEAKPWSPYVLPKEIKRLLVISDLHIPFHADVAVQAAVSHGVKRQCDAVLINGDMGDFYEISRWERRPEDSSKAKMKSEIGAQGQFLDWLRTQFPLPIPIYVKFGNHDERWDSYIWRKGAELYDLPQLRLEKILKEIRDDEGEVIGKRDIIFVKDRQRIEYRNLTILHGHELGRALSKPVNAARGVYMKTKMSILVGHYHTTSHHVGDDMLHKHQISCWSVGALCELHPFWLRANDWNWGFAIVEATDNSDESFTVDNKRISLEGEVW